MNMPIELCISGHRPAGTRRVPYRNPDDLSRLERGQDRTKTGHFLICPGQICIAQEDAT